MANKHISYRQFKNIFGDLGVTYWTKYNWLSNGLPDGEYNGITKITLGNYDVGAYWNYNVNNKEMYSGNVKIPAILPSNNNEKWRYGFSNYEVLPRQEQYEHPEKMSVSFHYNGDFVIKIPGLNSREEYEQYLEQHPIILYYYDRNVWGGVIASNFIETSEFPGVFYSSTVLPSSVILNTYVKDVEGKYESLGQVPGDEMSDKSIATTTNTTLPRYARIKDVKYTGSAASFNAAEMPRAIVYKLVPDGWGKVIFNGSEDWVQNSHGSFSTPLANSVSNAEGNSKECACNELPIKSWNEDVGSTTDSVGLTWAQVENHAQAFIRINGISDATALKTYLASHPITFYYKLKPIL